MTARFFARQLPAVVAVAILAASCGGPPMQLHRETRLMLGSSVEITVASADPAAAKSALAAAFAEIERVEKVISLFRPESELSRINREAYPDGTPAPAEILELLGRARGIGLAAGGAFDCTVGPLTTLWAFDQGGVLPEPAAVARVLPAVGWDHLELDDRRGRVRFLVPGMALDLGGIGEGHAVDRAVEVLRRAGIAAGLINAGGDIRVWGEKPARDGLWRVAIQDPRDPAKYLGTISLTDRAVVTSGDYEKYFEEDGRRYHHILNPSTGYPSTGTRSVTVVASTTELADASATTLMVLGFEKSRPFLEKYPGVEWLIVDAAGVTHLSPGMEKIFRARD